MYPAHIRKEENGREVVQTVREHCEATAVFAGKSLEAAGLYHAGYLAGLMHDMGKCRKEFADYIEKAAKGEKVRRGSVIHTFQGCRYILEKYHSGDGNPVPEDIASEMIAYAVAAHHGLFDCCGPNEKTHGFQHRIEENNVGFEDSRQGFFEIPEETESADALYTRAKQECMVTNGKIQQMMLLRMKDMKQKGAEDWETGAKLNRELCFYLGMETRMLLSSVIEGDCRDTARFMNKSHYPVFDGYEDDLPAFWDRYLHTVEKKLDEFQTDTPIQSARKKISDQCRAFASCRTGVYRLNVPTGAGKTLSSLRFALRHAAVNAKKRIIFTAPLLSILDQNAQIILDYLGDDSIVLEHYSNLGDDLAAMEADGNTDRRRPDGDAGGESGRSELLAESWNVPVIVTSLVQLLQTLFSGKKTSIRRLQALCGSIVIIDEVQTVPGKMLSLFNLAVNYLSEICDVTFLLCSATQPYLEGTEHSLLREPPEVVPFDQELWKAFQRTHVQAAPEKKLEDIPAYILEEAETAGSLLVVCNKKSEAEVLFREIKESGRQCFHLSAAMCMAHRKKVLGEIIEKLKAPGTEENPLICITTQVIEAGVDISFGKVIRFAAGMDSVVQAAGRCNRNGEKEISDVLILNCVDEDLNHLKEIRDGKSALQALLAAFENSPADFENDLTSNEAIRHYYQRLYEGMPRGGQDYTLDRNSGVKRGVSILSLLSDNGEYCGSDNMISSRFMLKQAFAEAGAHFRVFEEDSTDVVVPHGEGKELIRELEDKCRAQAHIPFDWMENWLKRAKPYTVSVYAYQLEQIERQAGVHESGGVRVLHGDHYDENTGVISKGEADIFL